MAPLLAPSAYQAPPSGSNRISASLKRPHVHSAAKSSCQYCLDSMEQLMITTGLQDFKPHGVYAAHVPRW